MLDALDSLYQAAQQAFGAKNAAREVALPHSRAVIRHCSNAIRALHRADFVVAERLLSQASELLTMIHDELSDHPDIYYAGFVEDAQKEFAEASATLAIIRNDPLPTPDQLGIGWAPYLNGLGEAIGELRRHALDSLRHGDVTASERWLAAMDDLFGLLTALDFPDALTNGLRRTADNARGIIERTRGDVTTAAIQMSLGRKIDQAISHLSSNSSILNEEPPSDVHR
jgi:translin